VIASVAVLWRILGAVSPAEEMTDFLLKARTFLKVKRFF
jgi:hypothetical protein